VLFEHPGHTYGGFVPSLSERGMTDLDEAIKEVNPLGEHEEESSQKIMELETLCKRLREDA
jgi:hypothetical protein